MCFPDAEPVVGTFGVWDDQWGDWDLMGASFVVQIVRLARHKVVMHVEGTAFCTIDAAFVASMVGYNISTIINDHQRSLTIINDHQRSLTIINDH